MRIQNGLVGKFLVLVGLSVFGFYNLGQWANNSVGNSQNGSDFIMIEQCKLCYNITENSEAEEKELNKPSSKGQLYKIENFKNKIEKCLFNRAFLVCTRYPVLKLQFWVSKLRSLETLNILEVIFVP